ncbi:MAG: hypothetical protein PCFJNLEI_02805 [Verrucomicrobiae bacterium]|nr:hypothetical protein [Verrucomicrobiae bacterium]
MRTDILLSLVGLLVWPILVGGQQIVWPQPRLLQPACGSPREPLIAMTGSNVVAVWERSLARRIDAATSTDGGVTWGKPRVLDSGKLGAMTPQLSTSGSRVVVVWVQYEGAVAQIAGSSSVDGGVTWQPAQRISQGDGRATEVRVAIVGTRAVAVWVREEAGGSVLVTARSTDGGISWGGEQQISSGTGKVADPSLAMAGDRVVVVWGQDNGAGMDLLASSSADGGQQWEPPRFIEQGAGKVYAGVSWTFCPQIGMAGLNVIVIWCQEVAGRLAAITNHSKDGGKTWGTAQRLEWGTTRASFPHIAVSENSAVAVWTQFHVVASHSADGGATWERPQLIQTGSRSADNPAVASSGARVTVVWRQHDGAALSTFFNTSTDGGRTWQTPQQLDTSSAMGWYPQVAVDGDRVAAIWMHLTLLSSWSVFVNYSSTGGDRWQAPRVVASAAGDAVEPCLALAEKQAVMLWPQFENEQWILHGAFSADTGESWQRSTLTATGMAAAVALAGSRAVAVWQQPAGTIAGGWSRDGGASWESAGGLAGAEGSQPSVAVGEGNAVAVWRRRGAIDAVSSPDAGKTWAKAQTIFAGGGAAEPQVAVAGQLVVATWFAGSGTNFSVWVARSLAGGKGWEKARALQTGLRIVGGPRVAMAGARAVVVWQQHDGEANRIYATFSSDAGQTWSGAVPVQRGFGNCWGPEVAFVGERVLVVWRQREERAEPMTEYSHQSMQNTQFGCYSADGGQSWSAPQIILSGFGESVVPVLAFSGERVFGANLRSDGSVWTLSGTIGEVTFP